MRPQTPARGELEFAAIPQDPNGEKLQHGEAAEEGRTRCALTIAASARTFEEQQSALGHRATNLQSRGIRIPFPMPPFEVCLA